MNEAHCLHFAASPQTFAQQGATHLPPIFRLEHSQCTMPTRSERGPHEPRHRSLSPQKSILKKSQYPRISYKPPRSFRPMGFSLLPCECEYVPWMAPYKEIRGYKLYPATTRVWMPSNMLFQETGKVRTSLTFHQLFDYVYVPKWKTCIHIEFWKLLASCPGICIEISEAALETGYQNHRRLMETHNNRAIQGCA